MIRTVLRSFSILFWFCWALVQGQTAPSASASGDDPENFRVEVTGSAWLVNSSGTIQAGGAVPFLIGSATAIDLVSDLGVKQRQPTFYGRLVIKPGRKHRIVLEGTPIRLDGTNTVTQTIIYQGQTFAVGETLRTYLFGAGEMVRDFAGTMRYHVE